MPWSTAKDIKEPSAAHQQNPAFITAWQIFRDELLSFRSAAASDISQLKRAEHSHNIKNSASFPLETVEGMSNKKNEIK